MLYKAARRKEKQGPAAGAAANKKKTLKNNNEKKPLSLYKVESQSTFTSFTAFARFSSFPLIRATLKFHAIHVSAPAVSPCLSLLSSLWPHHKIFQQQESNEKKSNESGGSECFSDFLGWKSRLVKWSLFVSERLFCCWVLNYKSFLVLWFE